MIMGLYIFDRYQIKNAAQKFNQEEIVSTIHDESHVSLPTIYCVGDSLTLGADNQTSYPEYLKQNLDNPITTLADKNINSAALAIQLGALDIYVNDLSIPSDPKAVNISVLDSQGNKQDALLQSQTGIENCSIAGIEGTITYNASQKTLVFQRKTQGDSIKISDLTQIKIEKPAIQENSIVILFTGSYEQSIAGSLITYQQDIIKAFNTDKYIVVSLTQNDRNETNQLLLQSYGNHYLDFKSYLLKQGLQDAQIQATAKDKQNIADNEVPASLLADTLNGNSHYNELLAKQLIAKMQSLGYLNS